MEREIIWSFRAINDRKQIFDYWLFRNKSDIYGNKLSDLFEQALILIATNPGIGRPTQNPDLRIKIVRDYLLVYKSDESVVTLLYIWDTRQDPKKFPF